MTINLAKSGIDLGIITRDAAPMLRFYVDTLGLQKEGEMPMPGGGTMHRLQAGSSTIKIVELDPAPLGEAAPGGIRGATGYRYWTLTVENLTQCVTTCEQAGYKIIVAAKEVRPGVTIALIADPDNNWVELLQSSN